MMKRGWITCGAASLALAVLAACSSGSSQSASAPPSGSLYTLHVLAQTVVDDAPFYIALKDGYFADEGLNVEYTPLSKTTLGLPGLASGQYSIVIGGNYPTMIEADDGIPSTGIPGVPAANGQAAVPAVPASAIKELTGNIRVLVEGYAGGPNVMTVDVLPTSKIRDAAGLAHEKVAVNLLGGIQSLTLNATLQADGVNYSTVDYVAVPFPDMLKALKAHVVDAADLLEPFLTEAEVQAGAQMVVDQLAGPTAQLPISGVFTTNTFINAHPKVAQEFQTAMERAQALADSNRLAVEQVLPQYIPPVPGGAPIKEIAPVISLGLYPANLDPVPLQRVISLMQTQGVLAQGVLTKPLEASQLIYNPSS
jgi:NitT/TauT family transport system substrate-binding protein